MALGWFQGSKESSLPELIAAKKYHKAIEVLKARFGEGSRDPWMRLQLADVLVLAGRPREAVPILNALADEFAREGFAAKAIAVLKKLQKIEPSRKDVEKRLAELIQSKHTAPATSRPVAALEDSADGEIGIEDLGLVPSSVSVSVPVTRGTLDLPDAVPTVTSEAEFEEEFIVALQDVIDAGELRGALPPSEEQELYAAFYGTPRAPVTSPLFGDFTEEELCAVIGCLELLTFQPGDIVITEGEPGDSLFVLTTGVVLSLSAIYELLEWAAALLLGQGADAFLGTQGDPWDTQWDMFLCLVGATLSQLLLARVQDRQLARLPRPAPSPEERAA